MHLFTLVDANWSWPWASEPEDQILDQQEAQKVKRVRLQALQRRPASEWPTLYWVRPEQPAPAPTPTPPIPEPKVKAPRADDIETAEVADSAPPKPDEVLAISEVDEVEPPPAFPTQITAIHRASYYGFSLKLTQQWFMEGFRYFIRDDASKFGFNATISSEGSIAEHGLIPEKYRLLLNDELKHFADYDAASKTLQHGKSGNPKITMIEDGLALQDMASLAFHVAVSYEGKDSRELMVTSGSSVYKITLSPVSQDTLKLPGGTLKTIHLRGQRLRKNGDLQNGYDIWIAPSLRNFPVKFRGPDSKGNILEMSLLSASFDGQPVFGSDVLDMPEDDDATVDALPDEIRERALAE